jgi:hypothetical protein
MQEVWMKIGEPLSFPKGRVKILRIKDSRVKVRIVPEVFEDEIVRPKGPMVEPIQPRLKGPRALRAPLGEQIAGVMVGVISE